MEDFYLKEMGAAKGVVVDRVELLKSLLDHNIVDDRDLPQMN